MNQTPRKFLGLTLIGGQYPDWQNLLACGLTLAAIIAFPLWLVNVPYSDHVLKWSLVCLLGLGFAARNKQNQDG